MTRKLIFPERITERKDLESARLQFLEEKLVEIRVKKKVVKYERC